MTNNTFRTKNGIEVLGNSRIYGSAIFGGPREFQFDPASLFANGEVGHWAAGYDPAAGRLYQVSNGTSPATAAEQPVGLALDTSQGLALGPELVTNGGFDVDADWTKGAGWTISGGVASFDGSGSNVNLSQTITTPPSAIVSLALTVSQGRLRVRLPDNTAINQQLLTASGTYSFVFLGMPVGLSSLQFQAQDVSALPFIGAIDNISVRELPGNHAQQATSLSRPTLSRVPRGGRRNRLTHTKDFANAAWDKSGASVTEKVVTATGALCRVFQNATLPSSTAATFSIKAKLGTSQFIAIRAVAYDTQPSVWFNLSTGVVAAADSGMIGAISGPDEDGFYRCVATFSGTSSALSGNFSVYLSDASTNLGTTVGRTAEITEAQLELGSTVTPYQRVVTARDVTEAGVPNVWHLNDDGNDSLPVDLPAGNYTAAWVNALGAVTIAGGLTVTTTLDTLRGQDQADALIINRALGEAERVALTRYWQARYASI